MAKQNQFNLEGLVSEISEPRFLQNGAEVQTWVVKWRDGDYENAAAVEFYSAKGLDKLRQAQVAVGDSVQVAVVPSSRIKEGTGKDGQPYRFWQTNLRGDSWSVKKLDVAAPAGDIDF